MGGITDTLGSYLDPLIQEIILFLPKLLAAIVIFLLSLWAAAAVAKAIKATTKRRQVDPEVALLLSRVGRWAVVLLGTLWALETVDGNITGFLAGLGLVGFTIGFALQDIAKNFVAGILLLMQQPFDVGDTISVVGYDGTVSNIYVRATEILTFDGLHVLIPNADVYINPITNYSRAKERRLDLAIGVAYGSDLDRVTTVALDAIRQLPGILETGPRQPQVVSEKFGESTIDLVLYYWVDLAKTGFLEAQDRGLKLINTAFEREGIDMPYPVRTVLVSQS